MRRRAPARSAPALLAVLLSLTTLLVAGPARSAEHSLVIKNTITNESSALSLHLTSISAVTGPGKPLRAGLRLDNRGGTVLGDLRLRVSLTGGSFATRSALQARVKGQERASATRTLLNEPLTGLRVAPGTRATLPPVTVELPPDVAGDQAGAVVPLRLRVTGRDDGGDRVEASVDTFAVYAVGGGPRNRLKVAMVVPLHEPTHRTPDGVFTADSDRLSRWLGRDEQLGRIVDELAGPGALPVDLMVDPLLVEEVTVMAGNNWQIRGAHSNGPTTIPARDPRSQEAKTFYDRLLAAAARPGTGLYAFPYANADLVSLVGAGMDADVVEVLNKGRGDLARQLGRQPDPTLAWPAAGATGEQTLQALGNRGVRTVILDRGSLSPQPPDGAGTPNAPVALARQQRARQALVPDQLSNALAESLAPTVPGGPAKDPAEIVQRILAESAVAWLERPNATAARGILLAPPQNWRPDPRLFSALLAGLRQASWLRVVPTADLARTVPPDDGSGGPAAPRVASGYDEARYGPLLPAGYLRGIQQRRTELASFARTTGPGDKATQELNRDLMVATASDYRSPRARPRGDKYVRAVGAGIAAVYGQVRVQSTPVVLTARKGPIQVTTVNTSDRTLTVRLRLSSTGVDIGEALSEPIVLGPRVGRTQQWTVSTRATGIHPVRIDVLTADGSEVINSGEIYVRSTAINRVTLLLVGGAGGFLVLWWTRKQVLRRRRRPVEQPADPRKKGVPVP